jgi:hypothetical protein
MMVHALWLLPARAVSCLLAINTPNVVCSFESDAFSNQSILIHVKHNLL